MLDHDFCLFLEYEITKALRSATDEQLKTFWCDGILLPISEHEISKKQISDRRKIEMTAFAGTNGQDKYELILYLGNKALSRYARGLSLKECLPVLQENRWLEVDPAHRKMPVYLD